MTHNTRVLHNGQKQILPTLSFSENRRKPAKTRKIHISGLAGRMTFVYGSIEPETYVSYLCFISYTPLRPTEIRKKKISESFYMSSITNIISMVEISQCVSLGIPRVKQLYFPSSQHESHIK